MEIERKFVPVKLPDNLESYPHTCIEQGYLCTAPVVRVRRDGDSYYMTYKGSGMMVREEYNLPLTKDAYEHLIVKVDGTVISKTRYRIPIGNDLTAELDIFDGALNGVLLVEVEFPDDSKVALQIANRSLFLLNDKSSCCLKQLILITAWQAASRHVCL